MARWLEHDQSETEQPSSDRADHLLRLIDQQLDDSSTGRPLAEADFLTEASSATALTLFPAVRSLYIALSCRDRATAEHSRRVADRLYDFGDKLGLDQRLCLSLELAGLLHDVGKIGVPDTILFKSGRLSPEEKALVGKHRRMSVEAIRPLIDLPEVIETLSQAHAWYDGSHDHLARAGDGIADGARMLAIVDAYDAMTSDRVYRKAMRHEQALEELTRMAGKQFDPELVAKFQQVAGSARQIRPLGLGSAGLGAPWQGTLAPAGRNHPRPIDFYSRVVSDLSDGVCFARLNGQVFFWSKAAERLTGYTAEEICRRPWGSLEAFFGDLTIGEPARLNLVRDLVSDGHHRSGRVALRHKLGHAIQVQTQFVPVAADSGRVDGVVLVFSDIRESVALEMEFDALRAQVTRDPLTGVYNRAEFDRRLPLFIEEHFQQGTACSLVVADLDYFKEINDSFGHASGDEVLRRFAQILSAEMGTGGVVARYGGEEFVVLLPTPLEVAVRRSEAVRAAISNVEFPDLRSRHVSASFGVSDVRIGDTPDSLFARADQALFMAKQQGRNRTVSAGSSEQLIKGTAEAAGKDADYPVESVLSVSGPHETMKRKVAAFLDACQARVVSETETSLEMRIGARRPWHRYSKQADRVPVRVTLSFRPPRNRRIAVHVKIALESSRVASATARARCRLILGELKRFLLVP